MGHRLCDINGAIVLRLQNRIAPTLYIGARSNLPYNRHMPKSTNVSDAEILEHVISPVTGGLPADAARAILELRFDEYATKQIRLLLQKTNRGTISADERITLERFLRIGKFIDLLHARARLSLKEAGVPA